MNKRQRKARKAILVADPGVETCLMCPHSLPLYRPFDLGNSRNMRRICRKYERMREFAFLYIGLETENMKQEHVKM